MTLPGLGTLNVLRREDEFAYLCVHGAGHSWSRLKWLADLNARLAGLEAQRIAGLYRYAEARGAGCARVRRWSCAIGCSDAYGRPACHCRPLSPSCIRYCASHYGHGDNCLAVANGRWERRNAADRLCSAVFLVRLSVPVHDLPPL